MMTLAEMRAKFPTQQQCSLAVISARWNGSPICPYCGSPCRLRQSGDYRHHCNTCNTNFSVTAKTLFAGTKVELQKWFLAIYMLVNSRRRVPDRLLAATIGVNKNTANYMAMRIRTAMLKDRDFLMAMADEIEK